MTTDQAAHHKAEDEKRKLETQISALKEKLEANGIGSICWFRSSSLLSEYYHTRAGSSYQRNLIIKTSPPIDSSWWQLLHQKNIQTPGQPAPHWLHCLLLPLLFAWDQNPLRLRGDDHHHDYRDHHYDGEITNMIAVMIVVFMLRLSSFEGQQHQV